MAFDSAVNYIKDYLTKHEDQVEQVKRIEWALESSVPTDVDQRFDREAENAAWTALHATQHPDIHKLIEARTKINWLASGNRDMRTQFGCVKDCRLRVHHDQHRLALVQYKWAINGLQRLLDIVNTERSQDLT
jgi:hypothetical protein